MLPVYSLQSIEKHYGSQTALHLERIELYRGRIYSLVGPNGSGKSTLLNILALLAPPCRGSIDFAGERVRWRSGHLKRHRSQITLVHQSPYLFDRSVYQNLAFGLSLRGIHGEEQHRRIDQALDALGLSGFQQRPARQLSGGEAHKVAMARALALKPKVLLLDEPTAYLHPDAVPALEKLIESLRAGGTTIVLSTHDPNQPERLGSEIIHLINGRLAEQSPIGPGIAVPLPPQAAGAAA